MNKVIIKLLALIAVISLFTTALMVASAEDGITTSSELGTTSSEIVSSDNGLTSSEDTTTSEAPVSSEAPIVSEPIQSSEVIITSSEVQTTVSSTTSSTTNKSNTSSKKSKKKNNKKTSSKKKTESYTPNNYYNGYESISGEWEGGKDNDEQDIQNTSSSKPLSKHITNPKKVVQNWIWLPVLIGLGCIGVLIYTNMYLFKNGKHTKEGVMSANFDYADEEPYEQETETEIEVQEDDPFAAENFFNFDDE